ncbi:serine/threonine-protein kinase [Nocardia brasiliensis]|uniref:serine/threonine-protein kinase n=1 Tax=Nocardia brasiliensis TaxID=37326 RepID=UPI0024591043|nr:serine/threonine-protein kinase [Nocardia brasiliensis]
MPQHPDGTARPLLHPWANRRTRRTELPGTQAYPWAVRGTPEFEVGRQRPAHPWATRPLSMVERPTGQPSAVDTARSPDAGAELSSGRGGRSRPSGRRFGAGLVQLPRSAEVDPRTVVLRNPEVPERKRFCWKCDEPVGRMTESEPGQVVGDCPKCGAPFNFRPLLEPGELVAEQYEVQGCLAHGGLGWIYLAIDRNVSDRWVVLKGLQNPLDFEAHVVALAERQFLSEMAFPGIVKIHNFVKHRSVRGVSDGYIVMEYVSGRSLRKLLDERAPDRIPVAEAIAYLMEVLPALDYLHSLGLAYNDLKPDNIMVSQDEVKLIDLGAVAAMESYGSLYGTPGYQAPEIIETGPTVESDIYALGRTLAVLTLQLRAGPDGNYLHELPVLEQHPVLRRYPFLYRLLRRATDPDPMRRFPSAYSMYCQLGGILRMVLAVDTEREHPQASIEFGTMRSDFGTDTLLGQTDGMVDGLHRPEGLDVTSVVAALPVPLIDSEDPSAELLSTLLHGDPQRAIESLRRARDRIAAGTISAPGSFELEGALTAIRAHLDLGETDAAESQLAELRPTYQADWRIDWYTGISALLRDDCEHAYRRFDDVHTAVPGELAPPLALAACAELLLHRAATPADADRWRRAGVEHYRTVWRTNHGVVSGAFGLARMLAATDPEAAVAVLDRVPKASRYYNLARMTGCVLSVSRPIEDLSEADFAEAAARLGAMPDEPRAPQLSIVVFGAALEWLRAGHQPLARNPSLFGFPFNEPGMQRGLESGLRGLARHAPNRLHRYRLIDLANLLRPKTTW